MKLAIIHLGDLHIKESDVFSNKKIEAFCNTLNTLTNVDLYLFAVTGDIANSGKEKEYLKAKQLFKTINGILSKKELKFQYLHVPGNHDLDFDKKARNIKTIEKCFKNSSQDKEINNELKLLEKYFNIFLSNRNVITRPFLIKNKVITQENTKIQINFINTAPFSVLDPEDKEFHYFPVNEISNIKRREEIDLCISIMHHSSEWFHPLCKNSIEAELAKSSEFICYGHDHIHSTKSVEIRDGDTSYYSSCGEMKFGSLPFSDSFNIIEIDLSTCIFSEFCFTWDKDVYFKNVKYTNKHYCKKTSTIHPDSKFITSMKSDSYRKGEQYNNYFVFPDIREDNNEYGNEKKINDIDEFIESMSNKRNVIVGSSSSGKTTLLKELYKKSYFSKAPLFYSAKSGNRINIKNFIKHLVEEQYGECLHSVDEYEQLEKEKKILIFDGWDLLREDDRDKIFPIIEENFGTIIFSVSELNINMKDFLTSKIVDDKKEISTYRIQPFFVEKRSELIKQYCTYKGLTSEDEIQEIDKIITLIAKNNTNIFSLNPDFIIRYTDLFIKEKDFDYSKGEKLIFSKLFELQLNNAIHSSTSDSNFENVLTVLELMAGYMFDNKIDRISVDNFKKMIDEYRNNYGVKLMQKDVKDSITKSGIIIENDDLSLQFSNRNYLTYYAAKYIIRISQTDDKDRIRIQYLIKNACFGIYNDILLFILYISQNVDMIMKITENIDKITTTWEPLSYENKNISYIRQNFNEKILQPTERDKKEYIEQTNKLEEKRYASNDIQVLGVFDNDESQAESQPNKILAVMNYMDMISKSYPAFYNITKIEQKKDMTKCIYAVPLRILYALLKPIDSSFEEICQELYRFQSERKDDLNDNEILTLEEIKETISKATYSLILGFMNHYFELCVNSKTLDNLLVYQGDDVLTKIQKLLLLENSNSNDKFFSEASEFYDSTKDIRIKNIIQVIVRKHYITTGEYKNKNKLLKKFFSITDQKKLLLESSEKKNVT